MVPNNKPLKRITMFVFIIRVELHGLPHSHASYTALHNAMEAANFKRKIIYFGKNYDLPPAEYVKNSQETTIMVVSIAKKIANSITKDNAVMVTKSEEFLMDGLKPAT